jgi:hypothetical protein
MILFALPPAEPINPSPALVGSALTCRSNLPKFSLPLFFGSDVGGETAAVLYSFTQTCQALSVEPWRYLRDVLQRLPTGPAEQLEQLLPDRWRRRNVPRPPPPTGRQRIRPDRGRPPG